ncbi:hypothetical protein MKZ26_20135 [Sporosarcina sp. FSL K6-6792]|uniref:hypothetical protein n=1 Tax=Sporosarcina sp. FSL K6-6792 TaxID=2921559 RepID=UPI0030F648F3
MTKPSKLKNSTFNVRSGYKSKSRKAIIHCLDNEQDKTFLKIAKELGVKVSEVYYINSLLEEENKLEERMQFEDEKEERLSIQMAESDQRQIQVRKREAERLFFDEGLSVTAILL